MVADTGLAAAHADAKSQVIKTAGRRGRGLAAGLIIGAAAAALIAGSAKARGHHHYSGHSYKRRRHYNRCERWYYRCEDGVRRACKKFYRYCD